MDGGRKAFRLEMIYWQALEVLAAQNGRSLAGEVQARLAHTSDQLNQSSALRASVAADLFESWKKSEAEALRPDWSAMIAALPEPAFIVSRRSVLLAVNEPLLSVLDGVHADGAPPLNTVPGALSLRVEVPPSVVAELASGRRFAICMVRFVAPGRPPIACRARMIPVRGARPELANLLGLLQPGGV
jgi:predicted DNA-binding ribbon-helix-helix protein